MKRPQQLMVTPKPVMPDQTRSASETGFRTVIPHIVTPKLENKELKLKSAGYSIGKVADNCEDAFFVSERGFGVSDGVSGWNDYGFSSHAFSN